jgi:hypothetical protein
MSKSGWTIFPSLTVGYYYISEELFQRHLLQKQTVLGLYLVI